MDSRLKNMSAIRLTLCIHSFKKSSKGSIKLAINNTIDDTAIKAIHRQVFQNHCRLNSKRANNTPAQKINTSDRSRLTVISLSIS